ncbi:hypothetical protein HD554DRAFT_432786 [Boletus coccyginus]|nr:hypothetical protein HD554DRAFT_432786 [Boletus coccyginus]
MQTFKGHSFTVKATSNADKECSDIHTLVNESIMEVHHRFRIISPLYSKTRHSLSVKYIGKANIGIHGISPFSNCAPAQLPSDFTLLINTGLSDLYVTGGQKLKLKSKMNTAVNLTYGSRLRIWFVGAADTKGENGGRLVIHECVLMLYITRMSSPECSKCNPIFVASCRREGAAHQAYLPIVAASTRASTLHYCCNDRAFAWGPV